MKRAGAMQEMLRRVMQRIRQTTRTGVVAVVRRYDASAQVADATPTVGEQDISDGDVRELPPVELPGVPVMHHGGSLRGLTFGLEDGDTVLLIPRHRSHQEIDNGALPPVTPQNSERMQLSESVAIPGYVPSNPGQDSDHFRSDGQPVLYMDAGEALHVGVASASTDLSRDDRTQTELSKLWNYIQQQNLAIGTAITALGGGYTAPPFPPQAPGPTNSSRVKVDE